MNSSLLSLPDEILILIAEFTPVGDLRHLRLVCKRLLAIYGATLLPLNHLLAQQSRELLHHSGSTKRSVHHIRAEHDALNHNWFRLATDLDPDLGLEEGAKTKFYFNPFSRSHILFEDDLALLCRNIRFSAGWALELWRMPNEEDLPKTSNKLLFTHESVHWGESTPLHETLNDFHFDPRQKLLVTVQTMIKELPEPIFTATMPRLPPSASLYKSLPESPVDDRTDPFLSVKLDKLPDDQTQGSALQLNVIPQLSSLPALEVGPELLLDPVSSTPIEDPSKEEQKLEDAGERTEAGRDIDSLKEALIGHSPVVLDELQEPSKVIEEPDLNATLSPPPVESEDPPFDSLEVDPLAAAQQLNNETPGADPRETNTSWVFSAAAPQQPEPWAVPLPNSPPPIPHPHLIPLPDSPSGTPNPLVTPLPNSPVPVEPDLEPSPILVRAPPEPRPPPTRRYAYQVIRVYDLFKGGPHPDAVPYASKADRARWVAANPDVKMTGKEDAVEVEEEFRYWKGLSYAVSEAERPHVQVVDDLVLFRSIDQFKGSYLLIWNWKTKAKQVLWFQEKAINYTIISHDTILVCCFNGEMRQPLLKVFSDAVLPTGQGSPVPATPSTTSSPPPRPALTPSATPESRQWTHRATFAMPNLTQEGANSLNDMWLWCTPIQRLRSDASVLASDMPHLRTQPCPDQALVFLRIRWHFQPPMAVFAMKRTTFLDAIHPQSDAPISAQTVRPWSTWGPKNTRLLPASHLVKAARGPTPPCYGSRIISLLDKSKNEGHHETEEDTAAIKRSTSVLDFSTATVEWALSDEGKAAGVKYVDVDRDYDQYKVDDNKGKGKEKSVNVEEKEEIGTVTERLLHLGPTARQVRGLEQVVETHLPYYEVVSDMVPRNVLELRVDDKRVFVATKDAEDPDNAMVVWPMWSRATA